MTLDERPLDPQPSDGDLGEHDTLLGTPVRSLFSIGTIRGLGLVGIAVALKAWPAADPDELAHMHPELPPQHAHLREGEPSNAAAAHVHPFVIDDLHSRWPRAGV